MWLRLSYPLTGNHPGDKVNQAAQADNISGKKNAIKNKQNKSKLWKRTWTARVRLVRIQLIYAPTSLGWGLRPLRSREFYKRGLNICDWKIHDLVKYISLGLLGPTAGLSWQNKHFCLNKASISHKLFMFVINQFRLSSTDFFLNP